jgi:Holliday junction resolvase
MINAKKKGNKGENAVANWLRDNGIKAWRDNASGGGSREKGDVGNNIDLSIEVKTVKKINLQEAWKQVKHASVIHHNEPALFIHFDLMPKNKWLVVMDSDDWLYFMKKAKGIDEKV